jgi:hypothetical protein
MCKILLDNSAQDNLVTLFIGGHMFSNLRAEIRRRSFPAIGVALLLALTCESANAIDTRRYYPIDLGSTWTELTTETATLGDPKPPVTTVTTAVPGTPVGGQQTVLLSWKSRGTSSRKSRTKKFGEVKWTKF